MASPGAECQAPPCTLRAPPTLLSQRLFQRVWFLGCCVSRALAEDRFQGARRGDPAVRLPGNTVGPTRERGRAAPFSRCRLCVVAPPGQGVGVPRCTRVPQNTRKPAGLLVPQPRPKPLPASFPCPPPVMALASPFSKNRPSSAPPWPPQTAPPAGHRHTLPLVRRRLGRPDEGPWGRGGAAGHQAVDS